MAEILNIKDLRLRAGKFIVSELLNSLSPREERILRMRYGIGIKKLYTMEEIAEQFNVPSERVYQIASKALHKVNSPSRISKLQAIGYKSLEACAKDLYCNQ